MNIIVGRHRNTQGDFVLDKFSLYYDDPSDMRKKYGMQWPLLRGCSFRTAIFEDTLDRDFLEILSVSDEAKAYDLNIDTFEDTLYLRQGTDSDASFINRIDKLVEWMVKTYGSLKLAPSYDPTETKSALEVEWILLKTQIG